MKKQIWLRDDQVELVVACLGLCKKELNTGFCDEAHAMAGRFTYARINEILALLQPAMKPVTSQSTATNK